MIDAIEYLKRELKYNSGPSIPYVKIGKSHAHQLVSMAETSLKQAKEIARLRKALEFYADETNHTERRGTRVFGDVFYDKGKIAREALQNGD